jgi:hypothetical protein
MLSTAVFNLADNGTDLGFEHAEYDETSEKQIQERVGAFAKHMKCAIWDWGERFSNMQEHLGEIFEYFESVDNTPAWLLEGIKSRMIE